MVFRSKIDWWIAILIFSVIAGEAWLFITIPFWPGFAVLVILGFPVVSIFWKTRYTITHDNRLQVRCGFFSDYDIEIDKITSLTRSTSLENSPALSMDRIAIEYLVGFGKDYILVSPKDKSGFVATLKERNLTITINV